MYTTMNQPWPSIPPPPGTQTQVQYGYQQSPAFHTVQVRRTFDAMPLHTTPLPLNVHQNAVPPPPGIAAPAQRTKIDWPQPVRNYVQRSFDPSNLLPDVQRVDMEAKLKETISAATDSNTLHTIDWDNLPLPQNMIRQERAAAAAAWQQESLKLQMANAIANSHNQTISKKRKSQELGGSDENTSLPWRTTNNHNSLEGRITYDKRQQPFQNEQKASKSQKAMEKRQRRFDGGYKSTYRSPSPDAVAGPVVGTCQTLEKQYFRLTSAPIPSQVRPEAILRQTLDLLKKKWKKEGNYSYICDQFKSMRQDLTVQRIKNEFTVTVYEIHARIALEKGDLGEYNQCQTQLRALYAQKLGGNPVEFKAYRILYFIHTSNRTSLNDVLAELTIAEKGEKVIKHALDVRSALALGNYHKFFRLYLDTPNMGAYLMDKFVVRERLAAMANLCKAFKPDVNLRFITEELGFESDSDAAQFIVDHQGEALLQEKEEGLRVLTGKAGQLFETQKQAAFQRVDIKGQI